MAQPNYRDLLRFELSRRKNKNPAYSLRAFARDLAVSPSRLSEILSGEKISLVTARNVMRHLPWAAHDKRRFELLVATEGPDKKLANAANRELQRERSQSQIDLEAFKVMSNWLHSALLALMDLNSFKPDPAWIAGKLNCSQEESVSILKRLSKLGLVKKSKGTIRKTMARLSVSSPVPSASIRSYHEQLIAKAERSVNEQSIHQRSLQSLVFAMDGERLPEAFRRLEKFVQEFNQEFKGDTKKTSVMALTAQLFTLVEEEK